MATGFEWTIENDIAFANGLDRLGRATNDFTIPFKLISSDFYRSNRKLFTLQGKGLYQDLSEKPFRAFWQNKNGFASYYAGGYKEYKKVNYGFTYPILVGESRVLSNSILGGRNKHSIFTLRKQELLLGSSVPYGKYHQSDAARTKIPQRKFVFIDGGPADKSKDSSINGRRERWLNIINDHVIQLVSGEVLK